MNLKNKNKLYRTKAFWRSKKWLSEKPAFTFWKSAFRISYNANNSKHSFRLLVPTLYSFFKTVIYCVIIILVFQIFNYIFPLSNDFKTNVLDKAAVDSFLIAVASIAGVFLGLYFTAISSIAGNFLIKAKQDVREFFLSSPRGKQYVQTVVLTAILSIFYAIAKSYGYTIHPIGLGFMALAAAYIVVQFWSIGSSVFNSMEPTSSFPPVTQNIADSIRKVHAPGFQWSKPAIQNHHRRLAAYNLELMSNLVRFDIRELQISDDQLVVALRYLGGILGFYSGEKHKIPTQSFWYGTKNESQDWALADSTNILLALNTGTPLQPKTIKDKMWFEEKSLDIAAEIFQWLMKERKIAAMFQGFESFVDVAEVYGSDLEESSIKLLFEKLEPFSDSIYSLKIDDPKSIAAKEQIAFVESQGRLAIAALLGLTKYLEDQSCEKVSAIISRIKWRSPKNIYLTSLPSAVLSRLEELKSEVENERIIEGKTVTQDWYIKTLCVQQYLFSIQKYFNFIKSLHSSYFQPKLDKLLVAGQLGLAVELIQRWLEFSRKYNRLIDALKKHIDDCAGFHGVKDLPWPTFNFDNEGKTTTDREKEVKDKMIALLPKLKALSSGKDLPDYFGQALTIGVQECYSACEDNDPGRLKKILPIVFVASLEAYDITSKKVADWVQEESKIIYSTEPLINLFEISGYAKLYSDLYESPELWKVAQTLWDAYLSSVDAKKVLTLFSATVGYRDIVFKIMPQAYLRTNWHIWFDQKMREKGFPIFPDDRAYMNRRQRPNHPSPVIRLLARWGGLTAFSAQEVFFATYLSGHPEAVGLEFPDRRELKEQIEKEQSTSSSQNDNDEDE